MGRARPLAAGESFAGCLGAVLRRLRSLRHLSQDELGRLAGYDGSYVGAVERAAVRPSRALVAALDRALDAAGGLLALWRFADQEWELRTSLGAAADPAAEPPGTAPALTAAAAAAAGTQPDPVVEAMELARLAEASDVGAETLASVERAVQRLRRAAASAPPGSLLPAVRAQRRYLATLLGGRLTVAQRRRLLVAAGWLSVVLARLHFEAGERDAAEASREAALRLARQAGNGMEGRLPEFIAGATSGSLLALGLFSLVRQQLAPSQTNRPSLPERYRMADDLREPIAAVVAVAEHEVTTAPVWRQ